jgi:PLP dependent protein
LILENLKYIKENINKSCEKAGRNPKDVLLIGVTKTIQPEMIIEAHKAGLRNFGENKVQELLKKTENTPKDINWHFIGHLQRNKVKYIISWVHLIHSVDTLTLAQEINKHGGELKRRYPVLVEVNTSGEASKFGVQPDKAIQLIKDISQLNYLKVMGLMTVGLLSDNPKKIRPCFARLRKLSEEIAAQKIPNTDMRHLSMGMSNDYCLAVEEGATMVRIGTAIFGKRNSR